MVRDTEWSSTGRRSFLGAVGALAATGSGPAAARQDTGGGWPSPDDPYYASLVEELKGQGLPPAEFVYADDPSATLDAYDALGGGIVSAGRIDPGDDVPFDEALRVEVSGDATNPWDVTVKGTVDDRPVSTGDVLLGVAYVRSPTEGATVRYLAKDQAHIGSNQVRGPQQPSPGRSWQRYYFPIRFDYASERWWTEIFAGYSAQTVEIGGLALLYIGGGVAVDRLPTWDVDYGYEGRTEGADWRAGARERIERIRKAELSVTVTDGGDPVEGASVEVRMRGHAFDFGSAVAAPTAAGEGPRGERYRETFSENFNKATLENALKVPAWEGRWGGFTASVRNDTLSWLDEAGVPVRGHTLVWATYEHMGIDPSLPADEIDAAVKRSIRERAGAMRGRVTEWDVHNHPVLFSELWEDVGRERIPGWWETAAQAAPDAQLYVNEGGVLPANRGRRGPYRDHVAWLFEEGAPVEGIGFMGHFDLRGLRPPAELLEVFDEFAAFGVPLQVTELDVSVDDRGDDEQVAVQRDYLRDVLIAAFSHPAVEGVVGWGFWADTHWRPSAAYYGEDWTLRPHGEAYRRLVFEEWWTEASGTTDGGGTYGTRGFHGDYEVTVSTDERARTVAVTLPEDGANVEVALDESSGETGTGTGTSTRANTDTGTAADETTAGGSGFGLPAALAALVGLGAYGALSGGDGDTGPDAEGE